MASKLIGLSGYAQSGKDTTAKILIEEYGFTRVAFADALRDALYALNPIVEGYEGATLYSEDLRVREVVNAEGWEYAKTQYPEVRRLLQALGTEVGRDILGENIWVDIAMRKVAAIDGPVVITDMRFPNEYDALHDHDNHLLLRIERPGYGPVNNHPSESALDGFYFDRTVINGRDIDHLAAQISKLVELWF